MTRSAYCSGLLAMGRAFISRAIDKVVPLREGEAATAAMMFSYSFLSMTAYNILKPITRSQFITALGADNLPYVQLAAGVCIGVLMQLYSTVMARVPRRWVIPVTQAGEALLLVVFWILFRTGQAWVSVAFYVLALILGILLTSQFWTLANDIYDARQARRLFGFIGGGASLGGAMGAGLTSLSVATLGTTNLLLVSAALLLACAVLVIAVGKGADAGGDPSAVAEEGVGGGEAIRLLRSSRHLQLIAMVIACAAIGAALIEQQLNMAAEAMNGSSPDAVTAFLAQVTFYLSMVGFVVQVVLTTRVHRSLGLAIALLILPFSLGSSAVLILSTGALWAAGVARVLDSSLRYTIDKTTREVLFLPLPVDLKYRAKPFVDVTVDRSAKAIGALVALVLIKPWGLHLGWQRLSFASLAISVLWIALALRARGEYLRAFRRAIQSGSVTPEQVPLRLNPADAPTIEVLVEELSSPDESRVLYAIDMLQAIGRAKLVTPLLLRHDSSRIRARALSTLVDQHVDAARWAPEAQRLIADPSADVRAAAIRAVAALQDAESAAWIRGHLHAPEPRVAMTAAVVLADSPNVPDVSAAEAALVRIVDGPSDVEQRRELAAALAHVANPRCRALLVPLIQDDDVDVARAAIRSAQMLGPIEPLLVPALISCLAHRALKPVAREVLIGYGEEVVDVLAYFLRDREEDEWVRRHIPATLAGITGQRAMDALLNGLTDPDGFFRYKVISAIQKLQAARPDLVVDSRRVNEALFAEAARHQRYVLLRAAALRLDSRAIGRSLLERALGDKLYRTRDRIFRLLAVLHPDRDIDTARHALQDESAHTRAAAIEYLDNLLRGPLRKRLMAIVEAPRVGPNGSRAWSTAEQAEKTKTLIATLAEDEDHELAALAIELADQYGVSSQLPIPKQARQMVSIVERLNRIDVFAFASTDELFRIARSGRQIVFRAGQELCRQGDRAAEVLLLLDGRLSVSPESADVEAPAALALADIVEGRRLRQTMTAVDSARCLALSVDQFLTMLFDNAALVQGIFRAIVCGVDVLPGVLPVCTPAGQPDLPAPLDDALQPIEKVIALEQCPLMAEASVEDLFALAAIARAVPLMSGACTFTENDPAAIYYVLSGEIRLEREGCAAIDAGPGAAIAVCETLAATSFAWRAVVLANGVALRIDGPRLFDVLTNHPHVVQTLFSAVNAMLRRSAPPSGDVAPASDTSAMGEHQEFSQSS